LTLSNTVDKNRAK